MGIQELIEKGDQEYGGDFEIRYRNGSYNPRYRALSFSFPPSQASDFFKILQKYDEPKYVEISIPGFTDELFLAARRKSNGENYYEILIESEGSRVIEGDKEKVKEIVDWLNEIGISSKVDSESFDENTSGKCSLRRLCTPVNEVPEEDFPEYIGIVANTTPNPPKISSAGDKFDASLTLQHKYFPSFPPKEYKTEIHSTEEALPEFYELIDELNKRDVIKGEGKVKKIEKDEEKLIDSVDMILAAALSGYGAYQYGMEGLLLGPLYLGAAAGIRYGIRYVDKKCSEFISKYENLQRVAEKLSSIGETAIGIALLPVVAAWEAVECIRERKEKKKRKLERILARKLRKGEKEYCVLFYDKECLKYLKDLK